jgi:Trypsin-like peptidase domain/AAA ATPase domain
MVGRSNVVRIDAGGGRGTGFLIRGGELVTALHVVAKIDGGRVVAWYRPVELRYVVNGAALDTERLDEYEPVAFDVAEDWVVLRVEGPKGVTSWEVEQVGIESVGEDWYTYGFPREDGLGASGTLTTVDAPRSAIVNFEQSSIPAMQLFSDQAAAGKGQPVPGFSGAPVVMGGRVVGLLRHAPHDREGITVGGVLFACPIQRVMARLGREVSKRRPPDIIDFTGERSRHQRFFGRRDILPQLDEWLQVRESGWLLLTGSPGLGKSAIFNHWLELREQAGLPSAFHFIRRGVQNWADPAVVRANLAAQIEHDFREQRDASVDPAQRLEQLLHRVSPVLEQRQAQLVLLVDGLDEAMTLGDGDNPIPRIFPHELPARVFVFAASRPQYPHLNWFTSRRGSEYRRSRRVPR